MRVLVLGCGPAGLMAAHGAYRAGRDKGERVSLVIASRKEKSPLYGAQYLHKPIPYVPEVMPTVMYYRLRGTGEQYRRKVYGDKWNGTVSPEDLTAAHAAWDIRATYDWLWDRYSPYVQDVELNFGVVEALRTSAGADLVFNSVPLPALCSGQHNFQAQTIVAAGDAPALGIDIGKQFQCDDDTVVCNGLENPSWYRLSRVFGHTTVEWPGAVGRVPINSAATVTKPLSTNCDCHDSVLRVGRYGKWEKGVLSHTAYEDAHRKVSEHAAR